MKKCLICDLNFVLNDRENICETCKKKVNATSKKNNVDSNKSMVEKYLLPYLRKLPQDSLDLLTTKEKSFEIFKLRLPLLIKCENIDKEHCKKEVIVDNSTNYRYYIKPYNINGNYYHICSQWWNFGTEYSKSLLQLMEHVNLK